MAASPSRRILEILGSAALVLALLSGCASSSTSKANAKRVKALERELRRTQAKLDELRERRMVLESRAALDPHSQGSVEPVPVPFTPSARGGSVDGALSLGVAARSRAPQLPQQLPPKKQMEARQEPKIENVGSAETGEHFLYSKVLESYRRRSAGELQKSTSLLLKNYPDSVFADNALYLTGLLALELGDTTLARTYMNRVLREYPTGNKAVSALFASSIIEKRIGNFQGARVLLEKVRAQYPGSPEAKRVGLELKLLSVNNKIRQES
jgi:TolA-binding protein